MSFPDVMDLKRYIRDMPAFPVELTELGGGERLCDYEVFSLIRYK